MFGWFGIDPATADIASRYLHAAAFGLPAGLCYILLRGASEGLGHTVGPMLIAALALALNAVLNYVLVYGAFGAPELGGEGCGWATAIVMWFELGCIALLARRPYFRKTALWARFDGPNWRELRHILKVGVPIGLSSFVGMALFTIIGFLVASLGVYQMAAHTVAGHINWATFVIPMSLGTAAGIRIGFYVGAGNYRGAAKVARTAFLISLGYAVTVSVLLVLLREHVVTLYSNDEAVTGLAATLIFVVAFYQVFDDTQGTMAGALRGYKDTRAPMIYSLLGYWVLALPLGWRWPLACGDCRSGAYSGLGSRSAWGWPPSPWRWACACTAPAATRSGSLGYPDEHSGEGLGRCTIRPSRSSRKTIWQLRRLRTSRPGVNSKMSRSSPCGSPTRANQRSSTTAWHVEQVQPPPHCARMPATPLSTAQSMTVSPAHTAWASRLPSGCTKTTVGIGCAPA